MAIAARPFTQRQPTSSPPALDHASAEGAEARPELLDARHSVSLELRVFALELMAVELVEMKVGVVAVLQRVQGIVEMEHLPARGLLVAQGFQRCQPILEALQ